MMQASRRFLGEDDMVAYLTMKPLALNGHDTFTLFRAEVLTKWM